MIQGVSIYSVSSSLYTHWSVITAGVIVMQWHQHSVATTYSPCLTVYTLTEVYILGWCIIVSGSQVQHTHNLSPLMFTVVWGFYIVRSFLCYS